MLGGGGFTGAVYEIGALRALDLLSVNRSVTDFDIYVGTSAGSFVAAMTANGVSPEEMMRVLDRQAPTPFPEIALGTLLSLNLRELAGKAAPFPWRAGQARLRSRATSGRSPRSTSCSGSPRGCRPGLYSGHGIEDYVRRVLDGRRTHRRLPRGSTRELYITATDLDTCERVVFGSDGFDDVPISTAVRASTALPMVYEPVRVGDRELVDGGLISTTNLDLAVEAGRETRRRRQPARAVRQRGAARQPAAPARLRHGLPADRLPGVQADDVPAPARDPHAVGGRAIPASTSC